MEDKTVYALGFFDGVHRGHAQLLTACRQIADSLRCRAGVVTFLSHPDQLVYGKAPALITTPEERDRLLYQDFSMDTVVKLPFDKAMMTMPWMDFYRMLRREYGACGLVVGEDFRFGDRGAGTAALLRQACREEGIPCTVVPQLRLEGEVVSSTGIRQLLRGGDVRRAAEFLGHPYTLSGTVVHGRGLGHTIGIPTANLPFPAALEVPRLGVYACMACVNGEKYPAVTNIGTRPTVSGEGITVEPWILGEVGDLYGAPLRLEFLEFVRPERKFPDLDALRAEIRRNGEQTLKICGEVQA